MDNSGIWSLFKDYDRKYFGSKLSKVKLSWSPQMTLCAGKTAFKVWKRGGTSCSIRLSQPLLSQRPHCDTVNTLLHEMIHAYLHVTQGLNYRDSHGPEFRSHMKRINTLEGSKITIYHNFKREVDKYRVNVYRCDGPCVKKRPFYGILRRAIQRPPGPTDRWWAQHQSECGGTFHKIGGPGSSSTSDKSLEVKSQKNKSSVPSYKRSVIPTSFKKKDSFSRTTIGDRNKMFNKKDVTKKGTFDEEVVLKRIRDKYSNVKQTIMLSKEAVSQLNEAHRKCYVDYNPAAVRSSHPSRFRHPAPFGNYVEGKPNYDYQGHTPKQIKIKKYMDRYKEMRKNLGYFDYDAFKSSLPVKKNNNFMTRIETKNSQSHCSEIVRERNFNYNYISKSPDQIKLGKYIDRYRKALHSTSDSLGTSHGSSHEINRSDKNVLLGSEKSFKKEDLSTLPGSSKTTPCPICNVRIPLESYDQHLGMCFGDDFDFDNDLKIDVKNDKNESILFSESRKEEIVTCTDYWEDSFIVTSCKNCGSKVFVEEMQLHLQYCTDSDNENSLEDSPVKSNHPGSKYCTDSDNETSLEDTSVKSTRPGSKDKRKRSLNDSLSEGFVSCPSCLEKVKEEKIHQHLDVCLELLVSEEI